MQKFFLLLFIFCCGLNGAKAQNEVVRKGFSVPFNFPLYLSGNFGELRPNHFHGGLDFKTQGVSGKKMLALADGYINRVQVTHDSGYVLHVRYNNGFTTISRHLEGLVGPLAAVIDSIQYNKKSWVMSANFKPNEYPVKQGEHIAWAGNMGYSFGPHLHLEVYETRTGDFIDPLSFFSKEFKDTTAPKARNFKVFPQRNTGVVDGEMWPQIYAPNYKNPIYAWGEIGVGIKAYDYMDGVHNKYGVKYMKVFLDDELLFESVVDRYKFSEHRYINSWSVNDFMKAYIEPGNKLGMLKAHNGHNGIVTINEERPYKFKFILSDYYGNTSTYNLTVVGKQDTISIRPSTKEFYWNQYNHYSEAGLDLHIPKNQLYTTTDLNVKIEPRSSRDSIESFVYRLVDEENFVPLHGNARLSIRIPENYPYSKFKLYIAKINDKGKLRSAGGWYKDGFMHTDIRELGTFTLALDTIAPVVKPTNKAAWAKNKQIVFSAKDHETGIKSYRGTIDGKYALFYLDIMPDNICYNIDSSRLDRNKNHEVVLEVVDNRGNKTIVEETFYW